MKKILIYIILIFSISNCFAQSKLNAVLLGVVKNAKSKFIKMEFYNTPLDDTLAYINIELNEKGQFYYELPITRPLEAKIFNHLIYFDPEEQIELELDEVLHSITKIVSHTFNNNFLQEYELKFKDEKLNRIEAIKNFTEAEYIRFEENLLLEKNSFIESYYLTHKLSDKFFIRQKAIYKYVCINSKYNFSNNFKYYTGKDFDLSSNYYDFMLEVNFFEEDMVNIKEVFEYVNNNYRYKLNLDNRPINTQLELIEKEFSIAENLYLGRVKNIFLTKIFAEILNNYPYEIAKKYISRFMSNVRTPEYRNYIDEKIKEASVASNKTNAFNFELKDANGKLVRLSDFRGKKVYLNFWASWCAPCMAEIENHNAIDQKMFQSNLITIMISVDTDIKSWKKVLKRFNKDIVQLNMPGINTIVAKNYKLKTIPKSLLINEDGVIIQEELPQPSDVNILKLLSGN